jgi:chromosome segregation ATPase
VNSQFDIAVKVALSKCLKFLVVDNAQTAEQCTDYLKEKGLYKELLVLENVPDRQIKHSITKELKGEGHLVYDVIEVSRNFQHLDRAMRYFLADKVVCKDFDTAIKLQRMGIKDLITHDGTEFKQGMISGGTHKNIFGVNLGQISLDRDIRKLTEEIGRL